ncbi:hypothetical protein [Microlunatus sp. GCM10028923]|uniref:hypothetical protein n=1 Tax=Microlunatus sp. GCM10028923 TaxID=3273400 RepID=UPI003611E2BF
MSALLAPADDPEEEVGGARKKRLRTVPDPPPRLAPMPFLVVLIGLLGIGLAGLLMLNTSLQGNAFETRALQREESELAYRQAELEIELDKAAAPQELARRASELGLRPNPYPLILRVPGGEVQGDKKRVDGDELPGIVVKTPEELAAEKAEKAAKKAAKQAKKRAEAEERQRRELAEQKKKVEEQQRKQQQEQERDQEANR